MDHMFVSATSFKQRLQAFSDVVMFVCFFLWIQYMTWIEEKNILPDFITLKTISLIFTDIENYQYFTDVSVIPTDISNVDTKYEICTCYNCSYKIVQLYNLYE